MRKSRAVRRRIEAGTREDCPGCAAPVRFVAASKAEQVIANVYKRGRWQRVEHWHAECYTDAGNPHGDPGVSPIPGRAVTK